MGYQRTFQILHDYWDDVLRSLSSDTRRYLVDLIGRLEQARTEVMADLADEIDLILDCALPHDGHPARLALEIAKFGGVSLAREWPELSAALVSRASGTDLTPNLPASPGEVTFWVGQWLLGEAALTEEELLGRGQSPDDPDLIRLERDDGTEQWPAFQFGPDGAVLPVVKAVNRLLEADEDPWGAADWWLGHNQWLEAVPARLIGQISESRLLAAAHAVDPGV